MNETKTEWYFIVNPRAGSGRTMSEWVPAERKLRKLHVPYSLEFTNHKRHATSLAFQAAEDGYRKIAAVGGDGSLHEVFSGICDFCEKTGCPTEDFTIAVAPIGSGNDWIKSFGVPHDTSEVIDLIAREKYMMMDVVKVSGAEDKVCWMANIGGTGFDSHVCQRVNSQKESGMRGKRIYLDGLIHTMLHAKTINLKVVTDGKVLFCGPCYSIAIGNGRYSGSGMRQVPLASVDDGLIDVMVVPKIPLSRILKQIPRLFNGTVNESSDLVSAKCRKLEIIPVDEKSADIFELDGEIDGRLPLTIEMDGRQIRALKG